MLQIAGADSTVNSIRQAWIKQVLDKLTHFPHYELLPTLKSKQKELSEYCVTKLQDLRTMSSNTRVGDVEYERMKQDILEKCTTVFKSITNDIYPTFLKE